MVTTYRPETARKPARTALCSPKLRERLRNVVGNRLSLVNFSAIASVSSRLPSFTRINSWALHLSAAIYGERGQGRRRVVERNDDAEVRGLVIHVFARPQRASCQKATLGDGWR